MTPDNALIEKLSRLSMLQFSKDEAEELKAELGKMISFIDKLRELNLDGVEPLTQMGEGTNLFREDEAEATISRQEAMTNANAHEKGYFTVPKMIRKSLPGADL
jgi:aspartyl-tRNA(Asn)/glutamyl-tRNA(Gln) amidotransferase subunit C